MPALREFGVGTLRGKNLLTLYRDACHAHRYPALYPAENNQYRGSFCYRLEFIDPRTMLLLYKIIIDIFID